MQQYNQFKLNKAKGGAPRYIDVGCIIDLCLKLSVFRNDS